MHDESSLNVFGRGLTVILDLLTHAASSSVSRGVLFTSKLHFNTELTNETQMTKIVKMRS